VPRAHDASMHPVNNTDSLLLEFLQRPDVQEMVEAKNMFDLYVEAQAQVDGGWVSGHSLRRAAQGTLAIDPDVFVTKKNCSDASGTTLVDVQANDQAQCSFTNLVIYKGSYFIFSNSSTPPSRQHENLPDMAWALAHEERFAKRSYEFLQVCKHICIATQNNYIACSQIMCIGTASNAT
jgi:hypothetical protein